MRRKTAALIKQAVQAGETSLNLEAEGCYYTVGVWETSPELTALCQAMNQLRQREIRYIFGGEQEVLSGEVMSSWITGSQGDAISLDQEKMTAYVTDLAARHDTVGTERAFTTVSGAGEAADRPVWLENRHSRRDCGRWTQIIQGTAQTADAQGGADAQSGTAAEQAADALPRVEGKCPGAGACVRLCGRVQGDGLGNSLCGGGSDWPARLYDSGWSRCVGCPLCYRGIYPRDMIRRPVIYSLTYKQKDRVLRGAKQADGSYEYESPVDFWMPFNGGIGFHDASWRGEFGGAIYKTNGSHGCVNLPPSKAAALYELVYKGMPVICYE